MRNPMAAIRSSAELMAGQPGDRRYNFAGDIMAEIDRMESWIRSLLGHARVGTRPLITVSVNAILKDLIDGMHAEMIQRRVIVQWSVDDRLPPLYIDGLMLEQIAHTVVANALDAMPDGGILILATRHIAAGSKGIEISITDTGVGIPAQKLKQTFTAPASTKTHGLGIGLPLVQRTVERMGGAVTINSQLGRGTRVTITLPQT
jgi:signal transduction histidine kinase